MARLTLGERLYRILLRFYPGEFRDDYEHEMLLAFRERLSHDRGVGSAQCSGSGHSCSATPSSAPRVSIWTSCGRIFAMPCGR